MKLAGIRQKDLQSRLILSNLNCEERREIIKYKMIVLLVAALLSWSGGRPLCAQSNAFNVLYDFTASPNLSSDFPTNSDGVNPNGELNLSSNTLYGTAGAGGSAGVGTVFRVNTDGTCYTNLHTFTGGTNDGDGPNGSILSGNTLYGTTATGGSGNHGTIFRVNTDGTCYTNLHSFAATTNDSVLTNADGVQPFGGVIIAGNTLYGTAQYGGRWANGTVFSMRTDGSGFSNLYNFSMGALLNGVLTNADGAEPSAGLLLSENSLIGTTFAGGPQSHGTVFRLNTDGSAFTNLHSFTNASNQNGPGSSAALFLSGNTLYGTAASGSGGYGTVFRVNTDGSGFSTLYTFTGGNDGADPGKLTLSANALYGIAALGGSGNWGTVFRIDTNGSDFTILYSFPADSAENFVNSDGIDPSGFVLSGNALYGTATGGGSGGTGTVFALTLPAPPLGIAPAGDQVLLSWPIWAPNYDLQTAADLSSPNWSNVTDGFITDGTNYYFATSMTNPAAYYRLQQH
jgi:uncharacterized repeat protein (TIGR03803 family)